ncbi:crotonase/enoyl-CoA hydratase family protein [Saccharomonospora xinjiangensis]|uniref:Enoyl-CoA hydratase/carnithine racemase n=1 Tax=Saccharomonospora xinjiangensis XJ-54 TaxID=882086 RepID=I0V7P3_9PSEU|nr:crotonase/enoyl-CoA hydratase family protein [Saccharomonospora xinjiangensis]EID56146.1 LOW QUALITY PROTEIN: enoyl-CoA hydratase/carnithine racemase [Saccharomonospora xinjiangensis XJ-54]QBQ60875.1 putative enoyl-CoA hydratase echA8 [Saccharomonospora xinjiangensis]
MSGSETTDQAPGEYVSLRVERTGHVAEVTLLGPAKGNAMGPDFWRELPVAFAELDADPEVRAVVLTGSGRNFSYGLDLAAMLPSWSEYLGGGDGAGLARPRREFLDEIRRMQDSITAVARIRKPVIAAVSGWCIGGGVDLISAADVRLASADATFSVREVKVAIVADMGSLQRLASIIGEGHLRELAFTGKDIDAARAEKIGLVNDVYADRDATLDAARGMAAEIAANPPLVVQGVKDVLSVNTEQRIEAGLRYVATWNAAFLPSQDLNEAVQAFLQRRQPEFKGE